MCHPENMLIILGEECSRGLKPCVSFIYLNFDSFLENCFSLLMLQNP